MSQHDDLSSHAWRVPPVAGARNLRDMGGYATRDGRRVKRGMLFRSGHPGNIAPAGEAALLALGLRAVIDLRTTGERTATPFPPALLEAVHYWTRDYDFSRGEIVARLTDPALTIASLQDFLIASYRDYPIEQREGIGALFQVLHDGMAPVLVNCTAGKDRTGTACALVLSALGVPRETVLEDYALTERLHDPSELPLVLSPDNPYNAVLHVAPEIRHAMMRSAPEYVAAMLDTLDARYGGVEGYLADVQNMDAGALDRIRDLLLET